MSRLVSLATWLFSLVLMLPVFLFSRTVSGGGGTSCHIVWTGLGAENSSLADIVNQHTIFTFYSFSLGFAGPALLILTFYGLVMVKLWCSTTVRPTRSPSQQRLQRAVTRLILTVITVYILCWLPHWSLQLVLLTSPPARLEDSALILVLASSCLQYANSGQFLHQSAQPGVTLIFPAINPVLYAFLSDHFKKSFREAFSFCYYGRRGAASFHRGDLTFTTRRTRRGPVFTAVVQEDTRTREMVSTHVSSVSRSPSTIRNNNLTVNIVSGRLAPPAFK